MNDLTVDLFGNEPGPALETLAAEINAEHDAAERTARKAIDHARAAGDKLLQAKAQVKHGQWLPWVAANCPAIAERTARAYMRLARNWATLATKSATVADLTINDALKLLNAPDTADSDPLETWLSQLDTASRYEQGCISWLMELPPAVVFLDTIGWQHSAIAERLSLSAATVAAILDPQPFERPDLLPHELNLTISSIAPAVDRCQREYHWHVAAILAEQRGFWCREVSYIARQLGRNDLAERFTGMEQVYFREGERAQVKIPEWRKPDSILAGRDLTNDDSERLMIGAFLAATCDTTRAFTGEPPKYPELPIARFIARLWLDYWEQGQAWQQAIADGATPVEAATQLEPAFGLFA